MRITQLLESVSTGGMGTNSVATAPSKTGKMIRRQKPTDNALDSGKLFQETNTAEGKEDKIAQLKKDHATAVHWSKNETSPQKREAARQKAEKIKGHLEKQYKQGVAEGELDEVAPKGWEGTVKAMKKHKEIDNPWALAHHMKNKGYKSHKKEEDVTEAGVEENKKGVRAVKHTTKPRNFVAKNAVATTSGAGAHKDKKKAMKQGETKHKGKEPAYESKLWAALDRRIIK